MLIEEKIRQSKVIPVIRNATLDNIISIVQSLQKGGIEAIEVTAETPKFLEVLKKAKDNFEGEILVGVGTVLDPETARLAIMAGADFVVTPTYNPEVIKVCNRYGILTISGAFTPTEILSAYENGAKIIKVFPAGVIGPKYIKNIKGPLPHIPLMVTGGIDIDEVKSYLDIGCVAVGLGSGLVNTQKLNSSEDFAELKEKTKSLMEKI